MLPRKVVHVECLVVFSQQERLEARGVVRVLGERVLMTPDLLVLPLLRRVTLVHFVGHVEYVYEYGLIAVDEVARTLPGVDGREWEALFVSAARDDGWWLRSIVCGVSQERLLMIFWGILQVVLCV